MTTNQARQFDMLQRVRRFAEAHRQLLTSEMARTCSDALARAIDTVNTQRVTGLSAHRDGAGARRAARRDLEQRLLAISRTARAINPDAKALFRMPRPRSDQRILTTAHVFLHNIEPIKDRLRAYEVPDESIVELVASIEAFAKTLDRRRGGKQTHAMATAHIQDSLGAGMKTVRTLDVVVANQLRGKPALMAAWERARRVDYSRRTRRKPKI